MTLTIFNFNKSKTIEIHIKRTRYQRYPRQISTTSQRRQYHLEPVKTSLWRIKFVILTKVLVGTSLRRFKLLSFIYVPVRSGKYFSKKFAISVAISWWCLMMSHLEFSNWPLESVSFFLECVLGGSVSWRYQLALRCNRLKEIVLIKALVMMSLLRVELVSLT